jgi:hypothetical protein
MTITYISAGGPLLAGGLDEFLKILFSHRVQQERKNDGEEKTRNKRIKTDYKGQKDIELVVPPQIHE